MIRKTKAQFAIEFIVLIAVMFLVFLGVISVVTTKILEAKDNERQQIAEDIATLAMNEIELARSVSDGYVRTFILPETVNGNTYDIDIIDDRELVVNYIDKEHVLFLQDNVFGSLSRGFNVIKKIDGTVIVAGGFGVLANDVICQNAQNSNLCGWLDFVYGDGFRDICNNFGLCN